MGARVLLSGGEVTACSGTTGAQGQPFEEVGPYTPRWTAVSRRAAAKTSAAE
jgi:hypothetical protein